MIRIWKFLCSLKLAVVLMSAITGSMAVATFLESIYDTKTAQFIVYQSFWFSGLLALLGLVIFSVAISRLPWKKKHIPFLSAHLGILMLLSGSLLTKLYGIDGNLVVQEGESSSAIDLDQLVLSFYDGKEQFTVDVPWIPPMFQFTSFKVNPFKIQVAEFITHAEPVIDFKPLDASLNQMPEPAFEVEIVGAPMGPQKSFWLWAGDPNWATASLGPLTLLAQGPSQEPSMTEFLLFETQKTALLLKSDEKGIIHYKASSKKGKLIEGKLSASDIPSVIKPGWVGPMSKEGIGVKVKTFIPHAKNNTFYRKSRTQYGNSAPTSAVLLKGAFDEDLWLGVGEKGVIHGELDGKKKAYNVLLTTRRLSLPFAVKLNKFQIDHYEGTMSPASFSSEVFVTGNFVNSRTVTISMNEPLEEGRFTLYQASYIPGEPRPTTSVLSVNYDPGRWLKYSGSVLIVFGSILLFAIKYLKMFQFLNAAWIGAIFSLVSVQSFAANEGEKREGLNGFSLRAAREIPIQAAGRVKPLDSFARDSVLYLTGSATYEGWNSLDLLFSWISFPQVWEKREFIKISQADIRRQLLLSEKRTRYSPEELFKNEVLGQYWNVFSGGAPPQAIAKEDGKQDARTSDLKKVIEALGLYRAITMGQVLTIIPSKEKANSWEALGFQHNKISSDQDSKIVIQKAFGELLGAYIEKNSAFFNEKAKVVAMEVDRLVSAHGSVDKFKIRAEYIYNTLRPFHWTWILYVCAALAWTVWLQTNQKKRWFFRTACVLTAFGFLLHILGFGLRCFVAGRPPVSNMYESIIWVSLGVQVFSAWISIRTKSTLTIASSCVVSAFVLISGDAAPAVMDPGIHPLVPVLRSNFWLTVHVLTITLGYSAFALSLGLANISLFHFLKADKKALEVNGLAYRAVQFGVVLLAAGTILGGVWADYSWGRFWGWDPKEVWALIALMTYLVILHGRFAGWVNPFRFAAATVLGFLSVLMAWYGVNFVLGVGLHSYGFSSGGTAWVLSFATLQIFYVLFVTFFRKIA